MPITRRAVLALTPLLLLSCAATARDRNYLPPEVERALTQRRIPGAALSVYVREVDRDEPLVSYNSTVARNPASTMKVLTTYAALELLGPAYTWSTRAYATGPVRNGVLEGDLVLVGGGDPYLTTERWWAFVNGIRQTGIAKIRGNVVIDDSLFAPQSDDRAAFDSRPYRTYNVIPDALLVGFQTVAISAIPDATSGTVRATLQPWPANLTLDNALKYQAGRCRRGGVVVAMPDGPTGNRISLSGRRAEACGPMTVTRAVMRAPEFAFGTFQTFWQQSGGQFSGAMRLGTVSPEARLIYEAESLTLGEVIRLVNKHSSNVMARTLLLTVAAEKAGTSGDRSRRPAGDSRLARAEGHLDPAARDREWLRALAQRADLGRRPCRSAAGRVSQSVHAGVRGVAAVVRDGRHAQAALSRSRDAGPAAHEDRHAGGSECACGLCQRGVRQDVHCCDHPQPPQSR
jgi:D-alanyl-D-alanine carboxypeptidase/D-alanyl-D-alanine-endopeptidase (penicillin-binding protein 4)